MSTSTKRIGVKGLLVTALALLGNVVATDLEYTLSYPISSDSTSRRPLGRPNGAVSHVDWGNQCDNPCAKFVSGGSVAHFNVFSDSNCRDHQIAQAAFTIGGPTMMCPLTYWAIDTNRPSWPSTIYVTAGTGLFDVGAQLVFTYNKEDYLGDNNEFVRGVLSKNTGCLRLSGFSTDWGMKFFPCGSGGIVSGRRDFVDLGNVTDNIEPPIRRGRPARILLNDD